jgi:hypothetical protein
MAIGLTHLNVFTTKPAQTGPAMNIPSKHLNGPADRASALYLVLNEAWF